MIVPLLLAMALLPDTPRTPVLVELFTSEGCSSCPPADALLMHLAKDQPIPGAEVIILSQHVDYWNRLGWNDPFSSPEFSRRQEGYASALHNDGPYTPQMVVDGRTEFVGSDARKAREAILQAAHAPKVPVTLMADHDHLKIKVDPVPGGKADVLLAITESGLQSNVLRGENSGKHLPHSGVVRRLVTLGAAGKEGFSADQALALDPNWKRENLRLVVFVQERASRRVLGAEAIGF